MQLAIKRVIVFFCVTIKNNYFLLDEIINTHTFKSNWLKSIETDFFL